MNLRRATPLVLLTMAAVASFFLIAQDDDSASDSEPSLSAGYYLTGVTLRGTNALGEIEYELRAARAEHDPGDGSITLDDLLLEYDGTDAPWTVRAARGFMPDVETLLALSGGVAITRPALGDNDVTEINTRSLLIELGAQRASTGDAVTVAFGPHALDGTGLRVDLQNEQVEILSNVTGRFEPREAP